mgnify:CR=1 FL=1
MASIDFKTASLILDRAFVEAKLSNDKTGRKISEILRGTHKTYRYILVTALLAKATNDEINILSLQKGDGDDGKYDARSLCHKVLVPFETLKLPGCLGSSNEPFLNKPARFVSLSLTNAVRRGNFKAGIEAGTPFVLVSHNIVNCMDPELPASLSPAVHKILREECGFDGIAITDDLAMDAVKAYAKDGAVAVLALQAGNDMVVTTDYRTQIPAVIAAVQEGTLEESVIDDACLRVLRCKDTFLGIPENNP